MEEPHLFGKYSIWDEGISLREIKLKFKKLKKIWRFSAADRYEYMRPK
jgi:hypothetical protein